MKKVALIFPGQGSQYVGMGKALCENFPVAKQVFEQAEDVLGFGLRNLCFEGSIEELTKTENTQPALLTASVAAFKVYMQEIGIAPAYMAGHSLGEFSALACADAIKFSDAVKIVRLRGQFMQEAVPVGLGSMAAVSKLDRSIIEEECSKFSTPDNLVVVSNYNSPEQIVISGHKTAVEAVSAVLTEKGGRVIPLKVSAPFHSPLMQPAADKLNAELKKYTYSPLTYPVISNVTALPYTGHDKIIENLSMQIVQPVRWVASMEYLQSQGVELAVELGPQTVLKNLMKKNAPSIKTFAYDKEEEVKNLKNEVAVAETPVVETNGTSVVVKCIAIAVCTQNRNWDNDEYQKGVVEPYRKVQQMQEVIEKEGRAPTLEEMKEALAMLRSVFVTKKTPVEEQIERFNQVFDQTGTRHLFPDFEMPVK